MRSLELSLFTSLSTCVMLIHVKKSALKVHCWSFLRFKIKIWQEMSSEHTKPTGILGALACSHHSRWAVHRSLSGLGSWVLGFWNWSLLGPFYTLASSLSLCPHLFSLYIYAWPTGRHVLMDNLEPPPTHPVPAPPLGSCPPGPSTSPPHCHQPRELSYTQGLSLRDHPICPFFKGKVADALWQGVMVGLSTRMRRAHAGPQKGTIFRWMDVP